MKGLFEGSKIQDGDMISKWFKIDISTHFLVDEASIIISKVKYMVSSSTLLNGWT